MIPPRYRICVAAHLLSIANITALMATPFFIYERLGGGFAMSGGFGAAQAALYAAFCLISSRLVTRFSNGLQVACVGITVFASSFALMPWLSSVWACGTVSALGIGAMAFVWPALHSWIGGEQDPQVRGRLMSWFNLSWSSGAAIGPLFAGPMFDLDFHLPFVAVAVLAMCIIAVLLTMPQEHAYFSATTHHDEHRRAHDRAGEAFLFAAWGATLMANVLVGVARTVFPKRVEELVTAGQLRLLFEPEPMAFLTTAPATKYSWIAFVLAGTTALTFFLLGRTSGWRHSVRWLFGAQVLSAMAFYVLGQTTSLLVMALCMAVTGANLGVCFFSSVYYCLCNPEKKHGRAAINEAMVGLGGLLGSSLFGYFAGRHGFALPFVWTPALVAVALALQGVLLVYGHRLVARRYPPEPVPPMGLPDTPDLDTPLQTLASHLPVETLVPIPQEADPAGTDAG